MLKFRNSGSPCLSLKLIPISRLALWDLCLDTYFTGSWVWNILFCVPWKSISMLGSGSTNNSSIPKSLLQIPIFLNSVTPVLISYPFFFPDIFCHSFPSESYRKAILTYLISLLLPGKHFLKKKNPHSLFLLWVPQATQVTTTELKRQILYSQGGEAAFAMQMHLIWIVTLCWLSC